GFHRPKMLIEKASEYRYSPIVYVAPPWKEIYQQDEIRHETYAEACRIHNYICETYLELGYQLIELPKASIDERVQFIINDMTKRL
ncbi:MAG TPA: AAA family ATPase, partial [Sunxiuqinia sp.]|nr:AAA family ATPase [Sunxiuqinia sp.]